MNAFKLKRRRRETPCVRGCKTARNIYNYMMDNPLSFTFFEMISFIGVVQCVYLMVHLTFRAKSFVHIILPFCYFLILCSAFLLDMLASLFGQLFVYYDVLRWGAWAITIPISSLVIIQMVRIQVLPNFLSFFVLITVPAAFLISVYALRFLDGSCVDFLKCDEFYRFLNISGGIAGALSLLSLWGHRSLFSELLKQKAGKERYWLVLSLIIMNIALLASIIIFSSVPDLVLIRTVLGLAFIYLVSTSLLRIYPNALSVSYKRPVDHTVLADECELVDRIERLLNLDKIYHEPSYSRTDMAQELGVPEAVISRIINAHFGKSLPQLLNQYRIKDAQQLLLETDAGIKVISEEVGFNSLPSFNRCFKDEVGLSPREYRAHIIK